MGPTRPVPSGPIGADATPRAGMLIGLVGFNLLTSDERGDKGPVPSFRDMLSEVRKSIREVDPAEAEQVRDAALFLDVREADEYEQGAIPGAVHLPRGFLEVAGRGPSPRQEHRRSSCTAPAAPAPPSPPRPSGELGYSDVVSMAGGFNSWKDEGRTWITPRTLDARAAQPLPAPPPPARGGRGGPAAAARVEGAAARRGRPRLARRALPRRGRRRHARDHRHGRRRRLEPPAPDPAQPGPDRGAQGRLGEEDAHGA